MVQIIIHRTGCPGDDGPVLHDLPGGQPVVTDPPVPDDLLVIVALAVGGGAPPEGLRILLTSDGGPLLLLDHLLGPDGLAHDHFVHGTKGEPGCTTNVIKIFHTTDFQNGK